MLNPDTKTLTRAELAKELRERALHFGNRILDINDWKQLLNKAATLLEEEDQNTRRYQLLKQIIESQGDTFAIAERGAISGEWHFLKWDNLLPDVDAAIDAYLKDNPNV